MFVNSVAICVQTSTKFIREQSEYLLFFLVENGTRDVSAIAGESLDDERCVCIFFIIITVYFRYQVFSFAKVTTPTTKLWNVEIFYFLSCIMCACFGLLQVEEFDRSTLPRFAGKHGSECQRVLLPCACYFIAAC